MQEQKPPGGPPCANRMPTADSDAKCWPEPHLSWCQIGEPPPSFGLDDVALEKLLVDPLLEPFLRKAAEEGEEEQD